MPAKDITADEFRSLWPSGYREGWEGAGYSSDIPDKLRRVIYPDYADPYSVALDIGCGDGYWTRRLLVPYFGIVHAVDVIDKPLLFHNIQKVRYVKLSGYDLPGFEPDSIDFSWSFGCMCHLTNGAVKEYLSAICRVMRPGAHGVIMMANWARHPSYKPPASGYGVDPEPFCRWTCMDAITAEEHVKGAGLQWLGEAIPGFRDTLAVVRKPL